MTEDEIKALGFTPWNGGGGAPADWDRGHVLVEDTSRGWQGKYILGPRNREECWKQSEGFLKVIGYRRKPTEQTAYSPELVERIISALRGAREALHFHYVEWDGEPEDAVPLQFQRSRIDAILSELDKSKEVDPLVAATTRANSILKGEGDGTYDEATDALRDVLTALELTLKDEAA